MLDTAMKSLSRKSTSPNEAIGGLPLDVRAGSDAKKRKLVGYADDAMGVPHFEPKRSNSVVNFLSLLSKKQKVQDQRTHEFLHRVIVEGYAVAIFLKNSPSAWHHFCQDDYWNGKRQGPKPEDNDSILRHTFTLIFGKGSKRASNWSSRLKADFSAGTSPAIVANGLRRTAKNESAHRKPALLSAPPTTTIDIPMCEEKLIRRFNLGVREGGKAVAIKLKLAADVCAQISVTVVYVDSFANPVNPIKLQVQKIMKGEYRSDAADRLNDKVNRRVIKAPIDS